MRLLTSLKLRLRLRRMPSAINLTSYGSWPGESWRAVLTGAMSGRLDGWSSHVWVSLEKILATLL